jgi:hypothetical protein
MAMRFANDGGPLIAFDAGLADRWHGNTSDDYSDPIPPGSDYERACSARAPADLVQIADGVGVVIGAQDGISTAWWHPLKSGGLCLVGCVFGERAGDRELETILDQDSPENWQSLGTVNVQSGRLLLLHAASEGTTVAIDPAAPHACIEDAVSASLNRGRYDVCCRVVNLEGRALYNVVKWQPIARAA